MKELLFSVYSNPPPVRRGQGGDGFFLLADFQTYEHLKLSEIVVVTFSVPSGVGNVNSLIFWMMHSSSLLSFNLLETKLTFETLPFESTIS